jgi:MFS family permease
MLILAKYFASFTGNVIVLVYSLIIWKFVLQLVSPYESIYVFALGGSGLTLGILSITRMLFSTFFRILGGYLADKLGRRWVIGLAIIVSGFGYLFFVFAQEWIWLLPGVILLSFSSLAEPAIEAIKADSVRPEERGRGYAIMNTIPDIPAMFAPVIGGYLIVDRRSSIGISINGIRFVYFYVFIGVVIVGIIRLFLLKDLHKLNVENIQLGVNIFKDVYLTLVKASPSIKRLLVLNGFFMFCFHLESNLRAVYAIDVGKLSTVQWGWIVSITTVISSLAALIIGGLIDNYGRKKVFIPSVAILGVSTLLFLNSKGFSMFLLARVLGGVGFYGRMISLQVLVADSIPRNIRGRMMGVYNIIISLGSSIAILFSGILYDLTPELPFYFAFLSYAFSVLVAVIFLQEPKIKQI